MDKPIDCDNEQLFKYIYSVIRGKGEPHRLTDGSIRFPSMINADPQLAIETFEIRYKPDFRVSWILSESYSSKDSATRINFSIRSLELSPNFNPPQRSKA